MKKLLCALCLILFCMPFVFAESYIVDTDRGKQEVVIPAEMTEKDVLLKLAAAYYNLSYAYDDLEKSSAELAEKVKSYVEENKQLRDKYELLISDYQLLSFRYDRALKDSWIKCKIGTSALFHEGIAGAGLQLGVILFNKADVTFKVQYPLAFEFSLSYIL